MKSKNILAWALTFVLLCLPLATFTSCGDNDDAPIDKESVVGTWVTTSVESDGKWVDVSKPAYSSLRIYITFYNSGKYRGWGALGTGSGTWKLSGNTITTYINNKVYITLKNIVINGNQMSGTMVQGNSSMNFKGKKQ